MKRLATLFVEKIMFGILSVLIPTKKGLMLFGSGFDRFSDNPKFLFLHFQKNFLEGPVWISSDREEARDLRKKGYRCYYRWSLGAFWSVIRAQLFFVSHTVKDIYPIVPNRGTIINLWHGTPIKQIGFDSLNERIWIEEMLRSGRTLPYERWDYFVAASAQTTFIFERAMRLPEYKIVPLGQPRTDHLLAMIDDAALKEKLSSRLALSRSLEQYTVSLYTPTFRNNESATLTIKRTLVELDRQLRSADDSVLLFKPHPLDRNIFDEEFFKPLTKVLNVSTQDTQELLSVADVLITDYSSILFDFMITKRPIIAYIFDKETYIAENGGLYFSFEDLGTHVASDPTELLTLVMTSNSLKKDYDSLRFNAPNSCAAIEDFVKQLMT